MASGYLMQVAVSRV